MLSWWETHPMTYDWNERLDDQSLNEAYFAEVDRRMRQGHPFAQEHGAPLFSNLIPYPTLIGKEVLELGCGLGSIAAEFARQGAHITAVDLTRRAVTLTTRRFQTQSLHGSISQADAEKLPFANNSFDFVWSWGVLHHTPGTKNAIAEIKRVLKPGGSLGVMMYNRYSLRNFIRVIFLRGILQLQWLRHSLEELENRYSDGDIAKHYSPIRMKRLFFRFNDVTLSIFGLRSEIFPGYDRIPARLTRPLEPFIEKILRRFGWFLFIQARKPECA